MADISYDENGALSTDGGVRVSSLGRLKRVLSMRGTSVGIVKTSLNGHGYPRLPLP